MCVFDLWNENGQSLIDEIRDLVEVRQAHAAFPAEMEQEEYAQRREQLFDSIVNDEDIGNDIEEAVIQRRGRRVALTKTLGEANRLTDT